MKSTVLTIEGNTPAKKNSRVVGYRNGKVFNVPSKQYRDWRDSVLWQLKQIPSLKPPYELICTFYFKDNRPRDLDNCLSSICDVLQDAGIIENDNWQNLRSVKAIAGGISKEAPRARVEIHSEISIDK